ncbi:MAG: hypothetical protein ACRC35_14565 [Angustibacter sp.]
MARTVFLDECKTPQYLMAATVVGSNSISTCREQLRQLRVPGTARVHFHTERAAVRSQFLDRVTTLAADHDLSVNLYITRAGRELDRRLTILDRVVADCVRDDVARLVLEVDESTRVHDERRLKTRAGAPTAPAPCGTTCSRRPPNRCCGSPTPSPGPGAETDAGKRECDR